MNCLLLCADFFYISPFFFWTMIDGVNSSFQAWALLFFPVDHSVITICSSLCFVSRPDEFLLNDLFSLHVRSLTTDKWQIHTTYVTMCRTCNHYPVRLQSSEKLHFQNSKCMRFSSIRSILWRKKLKGTFRIKRLLFNWCFWTILHLSL